MFIRLLIFYMFFIQSITQVYAGEMCISLFISQRDTLGVQIGNEWVPWPAGATRWHYFHCRHSDQIVSARPRSDGLQVCRGCGKAHGVEAYIKGPTIIKDGVTYILKSDLETGEAAENGFRPSKDLRWHCPYCRQSNDASISSCAGCGAEASGIKLFSDLVDTKEQAANLKARMIDQRDVRDQISILANEPMTEIGGGMTLNASATPRSTQQRGQILFGKKIPVEYLKEKIQFILTYLKEHYRIVGVSVAAVMVAGATYHFNEALVFQGQVVQANGSTLIVEYGNERNPQRTTVTISESRKPGRIGEQVEVHTTRSSDVLTVVRIQNGEFSTTEKQK